MDAVRVPATQITEGWLNAHYYGRAFVENALCLANSAVPLQPIGSIAEKCNCGATPEEVVYEAAGQGLIRTSDVRRNVFEMEKVRRTKDINVGRESNVAATAGDLLFTMSGTIGNAAVI